MNNSGNERTSIPLGIFVDDVDNFVQIWKESFSIPGFETMSPDIPKRLNNKTLDKITRKIIKFFMAITEEQKKRVALLIIDQFNDNWTLQYEAKKFVASLREANKDALIIEHSAYADLLIYSNSNGIITKDLLNEASALIRQTPMVTAARLHAIQLYSNPSFIEAGIADPTFVDKGGSDYLERDWMRRSSFERLMSESKYDDIKLMLGLNLHDSLSVQFKLMNADKQKLFLHYAWTIVAHMQIGNGPEYFGGSLIRLKESLKL